MSIEALQEYTRISRYARHNTEAGRRETWKEQVDRVMNMHKEKYADVFDEIEEDWEFARSMLKKKRVLGSQRALQFGGSAILDKNARLYNCSFSYVDRPEFFSEFMYLCLCGVGAGFSVQGPHIAGLPDIAARNGNETFVIPDSIEGWADAVGALVDSYFVGTALSGKKLTFDFSEIRPAGALIKSSGAKAPGPDGLKRSMEQMEILLDRCIQNGQTRLRPIDAYDLLMHASDAVVSGGIRRAATICLFSKDDKEMLNAKTGDWFVNNPQRGRSNNSVLLLRNETTDEEFAEIMESVKEFGEPGFIWADDIDSGFNPCVEINLYAKHEETGESGWQVCNLCEINMKKAKDEESFFDACRAAAILGTFQAGYTSFPYLTKVSEDIIAREALLGVSMTGMMDSPEIAFNPEIQKAGARLVKEINEKIAAKIGINKSARTTCVKPAGSTSCILGSSSGIHPHHAKRYFRRVQANKLENPLQFFKTFNPAAVDKSVWDSNGVTEVITFLCEVPDGSKTKNQVNAIDLLDHVKLTQQNWVTEGTRPEASVKPWLKHNVSNTITVKPDEWEDVTNYIYNNREFFAGISLLPSSGDKDLPQAPFTTVHTPREIVSMYGDGSLMASGVIVNALRAFDNNLWEACDAALGLGKPLELGDVRGVGARKVKAMAHAIEEKENWIERVKRFADNYFNGDLRETTYCLKDVHNWKTWCDLHRTYQEVPWEHFFEDADNTKLAETVACGGGKCELSLDI